MYNTDFPHRADLPTSATLLRSTIVAAVSAAAILVTVVLPADYGIDATGAGRLLGLTDMGVTKARLAAEAEADRQLAAEATQTASLAVAPQAGNAELVERIAALERSVQELVRVSLISAAAGTGTLTIEDQIAASEAQATNETEIVPTEAPEGQETTVAGLTPAEPETKSDSISIALAPGEGAEVKLVMKKGSRANFAWASEGGPVNFDTHGDGPGGLAINYEKGRGVAADEGTLTAEFDGNHGWFWRNRGEQDVTLTLNANGYFSEMKRMK